MIDSIGTEREGWLPLRVAARQLGVSPATLRGWANEGRVETYRTPGGHRRFRLGAAEPIRKPDAPQSTIPWRLLKHSALGRVQLGLESDKAPRGFAAMSVPARVAYRKAGREAIELLTRALQKETEPLEPVAVALGRTYAKLAWQHTVPLPDAVAALDFFRGVFLESVVEFAFGIGEPEADLLNRWLGRTNEIIDRICLSMLEYRAEEPRTRARKARS